MPCAPGTAQVPTVHPSTLEVMHELGLLEEFLRRPHQRLEEIGGRFAGPRVRCPPLRRVSARVLGLGVRPEHVHRRLRRASA